MLPIESPSKHSLSWIEKCDVKSSIDDIDKLLEKHQPQNPTDESTFQLSTDGQSQKAPLLFVDVNAGKGRMEWVVIYEGDTPESLAQTFVSKHGKSHNLVGLSEWTNEKLWSMFAAQMKGVLGAIWEEDED